MSKLAENSIPSSYPRILARELGLLERDLPAFTEGTGLPVSVLMVDDQSFISEAQLLRFIRNALAMSGRPDFGLRVGRQLHPHAHGPIGYLVLSSPDVYTALEAFAEYMPRRLPYARLDISMADDQLSCVFKSQLAAPDDDASRLVKECFALSLQSVVEIVSGQAPQGSVFLFDYAPPQHASRYAEFLHGRVEFNAGHTALILPGDVAYARNTRGNVSAYQAARELCDSLLADVADTRGPNVADRVRRLLLLFPPGSIDESGVAQRMFMSKRTLARRLDLEQTGFREIRDRLLAEMAARQLRDSNLSVEAIAGSLGYSDTANFRRAFRRWHGCTPAAFRKAGLANN